MQMVFVVEKTKDEYLAYCDELRASAGGATEEEAVANLKAAVAALLDEYGDELHEEMARRKAIAIEIS